MANEKEIPETPDSILSENGEDASIKASGERDPILEELLRSKSDDDPVKSPKSKRAKNKRKAKAGGKTGTSLDKKRKILSPLVLLVALIVLLLAGGGVVTSMYLMPDKSQISEDKNSGKTQKVEQGESATEKDPAAEANAIWTEEGKQFPVEKDEWQKNYGGVGAGIDPDSEQFAQVVETYYGSDLDSSAGILPSEAAGFTSDESQIFLEDGSLNPMYSFWTKEVFVGQTGIILEKFLNPTYGLWESYQGKGMDPNSIDPKELFQGVFTKRLLEEGGAVSGWLPIYADWNGNNYGRNDLPDSGPRWFGEIVSSITEFTWDEEIDQYSAQFTGEVRFVSYTSDGKKISQDGTLSLKFVANPSGERGDGGKVLVDQANLTIGG